MTVLTLPNCLSLSRIAAIPVIAWAVLGGSATLAIAVFCLVVASDVLDGRIARRAKQASRLGTVLDHGSDAAFVVALASIWAYLDRLPALLPVLIAVAFFQYLLDSRDHQGPALRYSPLGHWNGIAYFVVTGLAIPVHHFADGTRYVPALRILGWILVATTVASIVERSVRRFLERRGP